MNQHRAFAIIATIALAAFTLRPHSIASCAFAPGEVPGDTAALVQGYLEGLWAEAPLPSPGAYLSRSLEIHNATGAPTLDRDDLLQGVKVLKQTFPGIGRRVLGMVIEGDDVLAWTQVVMTEGGAPRGATLAHHIRLQGGAIATETIEQVALEDARQVTRGGITFQWHFEDGALVGKVSAKTPGWVLVGFNDKPRLDGARLIMGGVNAHGPWGEEHIAAPPNHHSVGALGLEGGLEVIGATRTPDGVTTVRFRLQGEVPGVSLAPGDLRHVILGESVSNDPNHHSRTRVSADVVL